METGQVIDIFRDMMMLTLKIAGPVLIISMVVGLIISIFQAATQIHEQSLAFVPKLITIALILLLLAPWFIGLMNDFVNDIFGMFSEFI